MHAGRFGRTPAMPGRRGAGTGRPSHMDNGHVVTTELFAKRVADLCLRSGMSGLPKDELNRHILLKSMVMSLARDVALSEQEVNRELVRWIETSQIKELDHISLRRRLVDAGYLLRRPDGTGYRVAAAAPGQPVFEPGVERIDLQAVLEARREEIARRKREYLGRPGKQGHREERQLASSDSCPEKR